MKLRDYQQDGTDAIIDHIKICLEPCLMEAATGAGKSYIVSAVAKWLIDKSKKKVLCLAPSKELTEQNFDKFKFTGDKASFFSASVGKKSLQRNVIFGTPVTVSNSIARFKDFAAVIIDEAHGITPTIKKIISKMQESNPNLRVIGLTATPYRTKTGYIYNIDEKGRTLTTTQAIDPYFKKLVFKVQAHELIARGFLTPPRVGEIEGYETSHMEVNSMGKFDQAEVEQAFVGRGRLTSQIVAQIVSMSHAKKGVMIFAATVQHAYEILESFTPGLARVVTGETPKDERAKNIGDFLKEKYKYIINVAVLTTGFDATHVDGIALMRKTESPGLLQQIIGRGLRLHEGKANCDIWDFAGNIEAHCPNGDVFDPKIETFAKKQPGDRLKVICPLCEETNEFSARDNPDGLPLGVTGYFTDLVGNDTEMPSHHGRRCPQQEFFKGEFRQCSYRWNGKDCPECEHPNDIAARYCEECKAELVDPNEKLALDYARIKKDPYSLSTDVVEVWKFEKWISTRGNETLKVRYETDCRNFDVWYSPKNKRQWVNLCGAAFPGRDYVPMSVDAFLDSDPQMPLTVSVKKDRDTKFFNIYNHNGVADEIPE